MYDAILLIVEKKLRGVSQTGKTLDQYNAAIKTLSQVFLPAARNCFAQSPTNFLKKKFLKKKFFSAQFYNWTQKVKAFTSLSELCLQNLNIVMEPNLVKWNILPEDSLLDMQSESLTNQSEKVRECPKDFSSESKFSVRTIFL